MLYYNLFFMLYYILHIIYKGPALGPLTKWSIQKIRAKREFFELTISLPRPGPQGPGAKRLFFPRPGPQGPGAKRLIFFLAYSS